MHLLFVDDDTEICEEISKWAAEIRDKKGNLRISSITFIQEKRTALAAIRRALKNTQHSPLLLLDLCVNGDKNFGIRILKSLKFGGAASPNVPIVVYSSSNDNDDVARCYESLANSYVWKGPGSEQKKRFKEIIEYWSEIASPLPLAS